MITEKQVLGKIEILEDGQIQLREDLVILRDDIEISRLYHRRTLEPGQDVSNENQRIQNHAIVEWTKKVIDDFNAVKLARKNPGER